MDGDFRLGDWLVSPKLNSLSSQGKTVRLEPKVMQVLVCLADSAQAGDVVSKETLMRTVWANTFVTDDALIRCISELRKTFAEDPKHPQYIQTIPKGGYRLLAAVVPMNSDGKLPPPAADAIVRSAATPPRLRRRGWRAIALPTAGIALALLVFVAVKLAGRRATAAPEMPAASTPANVRTSVAILPFKSERTAGEDDFGVEVADALTTRLSEATRLVVSPTASVLHYSGLNPDPASVGQALKVDYVLSGEIDRSRHNVTVEVVRIRDGAALLAATLKQKFTGIFDLEDSLCPKILHDLLVTLDHEDAQRMRKRYTENPQAYEAFLRAHYFMNKPGKDDKAKSIGYFQKAVVLDPRYAMAYAGLSDCYMRLGAYGVPPAEFVPRSRAAVMKALELDDTVAYAHSMLGRIAFLYDWDFSRAAAEYQRARELQPTFVHQWYASYLLIMHRADEAERENQKFSEFLPFSPGVYFPQFYIWVRRYDQAADMLHKILEASPQSSPAHLLLGQVYEEQQRSAEAIAEFQKADEASAGGASASLGHLYAITGRRADALSMLQKLDQAARHRYVSPYSKALIYVGLGQKDEAMDQLQKAFEDRSLAPPVLLFDPRLDPLRTEPRFRDFVRTTGLRQ
ncbi:MAG TPA: winged helix-turn-helix domain-containing protein [Candidatus Angelobacter sp.]